MALKIIGRTPRLTLSEQRQAPLKAREIAMRCDQCGKLCYGTLPYTPTPQQRLQKMRAAMNEHRKVCQAAPPEEQRTFQLIYPRA